MATMQTIRALALIAAAAFSSEACARSAASSIAPPGPCERQMIRASKQHNVPVNVLYAVGLTETGRKQALQPYAMNIEGAAVFPSDLNEALKRFRAARARGAKLIDIGCMQINYHYHASAFGDVTSMFDPARNVDYAARFLKTLRAREGNWTMAVARYHAGPRNTAAQKRYICAVIVNMVSSGLGAWTPAASAFCK
jgi:soluble lytic murein transglycosylase-like protein